MKLTIWQKNLNASLVPSCQRNFTPVGLYRVNVFEIMY